MAKKIGGLGRDLYSVLNDNATQSKDSCGELLRISFVEPRRDQPRKEFDPEALEALAESIKQYGVLQPIIVRESGFDSYEIVAGERRWRAAKMAGLTYIPAIMLDGNEQKAAEVALIENVQREDLNPIEEAEAYAELINIYGLTQEQIATQMGKSRSAIANMLRLLSLPEEVIGYLRTGLLTTGHARALLGLEYKEDILPLAERIMTRGLSVREVESAVKRLNSMPRGEDEESETGLTEQRSFYMKDLESRTSSTLGRRVHIHNTKKKKAIEIVYSDDSDLEALLIKLCGENFFSEQN